MDMMFAGVLGWEWWVFMSADGYSGMQLRVGDQKTDSNGHEYPLWT